MWAPAFRSLQATGFGDWQFFHHMWEAGYVALTRFGEWPLWDPFHCGGITIFGNPQSQHLSPFYAFAFIAGPTIGTKLFLLLHATAGFAGMYLFARREHDLDVLPACLASTAWACSGFFAWHGSGGHSAFLPFYLAPLIVLAWRAAARDPRHSASVAALMTLVLLEGGVYPFPYLCVLLAFDAAARWWANERRAGIVLAAVLAGPLTALMGAIRALPIIDELRRNPRHMPSSDGVTPAEVIEMLTARDHAWRYGEHQFVWPEYGTFVGWGVVLLGFAGVFVAWRQGRRIVAAGALLFGGLALGDHGPFFPWPLLHNLPIYDSLRVPSRFMVFFSFFLALGAAASLSAIRIKLHTFRLRPKLDVVRRGLAPAIVLGLVVDLLVVNLNTIDQWKQPPIADGPVAKRHHLTAKYPYGRWYASYPRMGIGSTHCYEAMAFEVAKGLWKGDVPQARIDGQGSVQDWGRTTSTAWAQVTLPAPAIVRFNQNWAPGWRSNVGKARADKKGRLVVDAPAGRHRIQLTYRPPTLGWGSALSLLGLALTLLVGRFATSTRVRSWRERLVRWTGYARTAP
jgi:hypothetical protein